MNNEIEADYLVEKLAGRLVRGLPMTDNDGNAWLATSYKVFRQHPMPNMLREETLAEYRQRKEQK